MALVSDNYIVSNSETTGHINEMEKDQDSQQNEKTVTTIEDENGTPNGATFVIFNGLKLGRSLYCNISLSQYIAKLDKFVMTTRFNNNTWNENRQYREQYPRFGCIYCSPSPVSGRIPVDGTLFVLEMNNELNRIMGIGLVKNHPRVNALMVYKNANYNRYQFYGKYRIDRSDMTEEEEIIMKVFDILCFTGNSHQKRGQGLSVFPFKMLYKCLRIMDLVEFISNMFRRIGKPKVSPMTPSY
jgi:hypothetical protein